MFLNETHAVGIRHADDPTEWPWVIGCLRCDNFKATLMEWLGTASGLTAAVRHFEDHGIILTGVPAHEKPTMHMTAKERRVAAQEKMHARIRQLTKERDDARSRNTSLERLNDALTELLDEHSKAGFPVPVATLRLLQRNVSGGF
jgi:hypothetical protein